MSYPYSNIAALATSGTSASRTLSGHSKQTLVSASKDCYIAFDADTVSATGGYLIKAGEQYVFDILYPSKICAIQSSEAGRVTVMELGDIQLHVAESATFTGDASIKIADVTTDFLGDAKLKLVLSDDFTGKSNLKIVSASTITGNTNLKVVLASSLNGDSNLLRTPEQSLSGDSSLVNTYSSSITGDASKATRTSATATSDSNLQKELNESLTGDSNLLDDKHVGAFSSDANLASF